MTRPQKAERAEAIARLHEWVKPGDTIYTILRHVSRSGMQREIGVVLLLPDERKAALDAREGGRTPIDLHPNHPVARAIGAKVGKHDGVIMGGCGMDMGFALVYELAARLYPDGFGCVGEGCPSNDHSNGDRDYTPHSSATRRVLFHDRTEHPRHDCEAVGDWSPGRAPTGAKVFCAEDGRQYFIFDDEVDSDEAHEGAHWHREGGYALRQRWL